MENFTSILIKKDLVFKNISFSFGMQKAKLHCFLQYKIQSYYRLKKLAF